MLHFYHQRADTVWEGLGRNAPSWRNLAVSLQSKGSAITRSLTAAILTLPTRQNLCMIYLSFNSITRLWSFYVIHLGPEAACVVVSGGADAILYHHRDNLDVLFLYCDSCLGSCFLLGPDRGQLLSLSFSLSSTISLVQSFQMKNELFLNIDAERIH